MGRNIGGEALTGEQKAGVVRVGWIGFEIVLFFLQGLFDLSLVFYSVPVILLLFYCRSPFLGRAAYKPNK